MIAFNTIEAPMPGIDPERLRQWIVAVASSYGRYVGDINYIFVSEERMLAVNRQYLQHDYYTDIITFDYTEGHCLSGDLFISPDTVRTNAQEVGTTFEEELHRVIIHGVLHLCGLGDKGPGERGIMEAAENKSLALLLSL
ncbi:MAG: rRNA maturation RNase YbeY [Prevotellaceae bacterium]|nr:rRNA maturation RNase YbeY [Prevotellaceae bacterium]